MYVDHSNIIHTIHNTHNYLIFFYKDIQIPKTTLKYCVCYNVHNTGVGGGRRDRPPLQNEREQGPTSAPPPPRPSMTFPVNK